MTGGARKRTRVWRSGIEDIPRRRRGATPNRAARHRFPRRDYARLDYSASVMAMSEALPPAAAVLVEITRSSAKRRR
ncbi:hypothetical protein GCM10007148_13960 [Parvularcula lutaonensis]|nr:hypothetical protein GCM10007148_13960 [Parvularcula lutaonensis]